MKNGKSPIVNAEQIINIGKLSTRRLTAIPLEVCKILGLEVGDKILYLLEDGRVYIRKV